VHQKTWRGLGAKPLFRRQSPHEAETLLAFGRSMKTTNLIFENAKMTFISHTLACVWLPEGTLSPLKFLLGGSWAGGKRKGTRGSCPPPYTLPLWRSPWYGPFTAYIAVWLDDRNEVGPPRTVQNQHNLNIRAKNMTMSEKCHFVSTVNSEILIKWTLAVTEM